MNTDEGKWPAPPVVFGEMQGAIADGDPGSFRGSGSGDSALPLFLPPGTERYEGSSKGGEETASLVLPEVRGEPGGVAEVDPREGSRSDAIMAPGGVLGLEGVTEMEGPREGEGEGEGAGETPVNEGTGAETPNGNVGLTPPSAESPDPAEEVAALLEGLAEELRRTGAVPFNPEGRESSRLEGLLRGMLSGYLAHLRGGEG